jgi:predicted glycosyltransferase
MTIKTKSNNPQKRNLAIPCEPMPEDEFFQLIKEAEKGPFISGEELKLKMQSWIKKAEA